MGCRPVRSPKFTGGEPIFQDLYVYIFVLLEFICIIYGRIMCEKAKKSRTIDYFSRAPEPKTGFFKVSRDSVRKF